MTTHIVIMAGGQGTRLFPLSTPEKPKQFLDLFGTGRTLLQQTYDRVAKFIDPSHIYVSTNVAYLPLVYEQLPEVDDMHILEEPVRRGTLAAVAWGSVFIAKQDPESVLFVTPSDQLILNEEALHRDLEETWAVVAEAIQTILRREGYPHPYEALKALTRTNEHMTEETIHRFIETLNVSERVKQELRAITPWNYTGLTLNIDKL